MGAHWVIKSVRLKQRGMGTKRIESKGGEQDSSRCEHEAHGDPKVEQGHARCAHEVKQCTGACYEHELQCGQNPPSHSWHLPWRTHIALRSDGDYRRRAT